ncbi:hypothetical protein [Sinorhizobium meliloti]|uniref:hypothetical protein n=1 Tax=Rhizobium meliloti TaxID=382 RepID=UPI000FDB1D5C|nr:hypothetical protein [Sinorhizobium meliloti]RVG25035.1 hypothetical protein CN229_24000 [Sinorhizobium meliloti]
MDNGVRDEDEPKSSSGKLMFFGLLSLLWLAAAFLVGWTAHTPEGNCIGTFACLTANEWGDFLAGVFAPIAFLWLVATVWIQADELRAQRKELSLTREEFKANRVVMNEQAKEAKRQAEFIEVQTQIFADEANSRRRQEQLASFTILMDRFIRHGRENHDKVGFRFQNNTMNLIAPIRNEGVSEERYVELQDEHLDRVVAFVNPHAETINADAFKQSFLYIYSAEEIVDLIPYHSRVGWKMSRMSTLLDKYGQIIETIPQLAELLPHLKAREARIAAKIHTL